MKRPFFLSLLTLMLAAQTHAGAEQATWVRDPQISPDGQAVAFVLRGQIRVVPARGGVSVAVTPSGSSSSAPVWSPDGQHLAFANDVNGDKDVYVMPASGGNMKRRTFSSVDETPTGFSPDSKDVLYTSQRLGDAQISRFGGAQLYTTPVTQGRARLLVATQVNGAHWNPAGTKLVYVYRTSVDPQARQHRVAANANEIWLYDAATRQHTPLVRDGKDARDPVWSPDGAAMYYLSERSGVLNVWKRQLSSGQDVQLTRFSGQPVRGLSVSNTGALAFSQGGALYLLPASQTQPQRVQVDVPEGRDVEAKTYTSSESGELAVSPDGQTVALTARGDIFLMDKKGRTYQVTHTPEEERNVTFSADGGFLVYDSARKVGGTLDWRLYKTRLPKDAKQYALAGAYTESLINTGEGTAQSAQFSPDGSKLAFVYERREVRVLDVKTGKVVTLYGQGDLLTSYSDGDIRYHWSPDSRLLLVPWRTVPFSVVERWAVVPADGSGKLQPISPKLASVKDAFWSADGTRIIAHTTRDVPRELDGTPEGASLYSIFLSPESRSDFLKFAEQHEEESKPESKKGSAGSQNDEGKAKGGAGQPPQPSVKPPAPKPQPQQESEADEEAPEELKPYTFAAQRDSKLESPLLSPAPDMVFALPDRLHLLLVSAEEDKLTLSQFNLLTKVTDDLGSVDEVDTKDLRPNAGSLSENGETLTVMAGESILHIPLENPERTERLSIHLRQRQVPAHMRQAAFDLAWLDLKQTFYRKDLQGVDWNAAYRTYSPYLNDIANPAELARLIDELSGSLSASHLFPASSYKPPRDTGAQTTDTASLGLFIDGAYAGPGVKIAALLPGGPLDRTDLAVKAGDVVLSINGQAVSDPGSLDALLDGQAGKLVAVGVQRGQQTRSLNVKPSDLEEEGRLNDQRITDSRRAEVERRSGGKLAYTYLPVMDNGAFITTYNDLLAVQDERQAAVIDVRANVGGDLYRQLMNFLSGKTYALYGREGRPQGKDPSDRWHKPSALVTDSFAYSDGSVFPQAYQDAKLGPVIGTLQLNTGTGINSISSNLVPELAYSVPVLPMRRLDGSYYENNVIRPDILVPHDPNAEQAGRDLALEQAVKALTK